MDIERRSLLKVFGATSVLFLTGIAGFAMPGKANGTAVPDVDPQIEKSVRAHFGGGFSVRTHRRSGQLTYANIEHLGNRFVVASANLFDWSIVSAGKLL